MPLVLETLKTFFLSKDEKSLLSHTYLYTPMPPDTHTPLRYACGSSGLRAAPPLLGPPRRAPPPTLPPRSTRGRGMGGTGEGEGAATPPPPHGPCRPKFQPPQSEGAGRGLVPLGDQETGEQAFCCPPPPPPNRNGAESRPSTAPPPSMPSHPRTLTAGRHMVIKVPPLTDRERTPNDGYVGIWDLHGNPAGGPPLPNK